MKKSYSLLITLVLVTTFSFLAIFILEKKSMQIENSKKLFLQTQTMLQLNFFKRYIKTLDLKNKCYKDIEIVDGIYKLSAKLKYEDECKTAKNKVTIDIFANSKIKLDEVNLHEKFILEI